MITVQSIFHVNLNINLIEQNLSQINGRIKINVNVSVKKFMYLKKIMFGILQHVFVKMENISIIDSWYYLLLHDKAKHLLPFYGIKN